MGFFDLSIPFDPSGPGSDKANRIKLATKAMELGYGGVAYNRTMKGVMSDQDRCSIPLLSLSSLLKVAPSLSASVSLHRELLGIPRSSPFRQYTRLTVSADSISQTQALNSGNPVLKSYDLVAVRPLNQSAFDHACVKSEVDIIAIDFSEKLPFRLKLPMVKAAIGRGVYFEITYSRLIADIQVRRQMISNAKLLVDWTRGKNIIVSSAAASVNEIRGPYDVANLLSLLGVTMERAKASISRNCRTLIANALRKKQFYKETIRVEAIPSTGKQDDELWSLDWDIWDPISSGTGDLRLEDLGKSLPASKEASKTVKAIDFSSVIETKPSQGFQVKDLIQETEVVSQTTKDGQNLLGTPAVVDMSVETQETDSASKDSSCDISLEQTRSSDEVPEEPLLAMETIDAEEDPVQTDATSEDDSLVEPLIPSEAVDSEADRFHSDAAKDEVLSLNESDMPAELDQTDMGSKNPFLMVDLNLPLHCESSVIDTMMRDAVAYSQIDDINLTNCQINEECRHLDSPIQIEEEPNRDDGLPFETDGDVEKAEDSSEMNTTGLCLDTRSPTEASLISSDVPSDCKAKGENQTNAGLLADGLHAVPHDKMELLSCTVPVDDDPCNDQMKIMTDPSLTNDKSLVEVGSENQKQSVDEEEPSHSIPRLFFSAGRAKPRRPLGAVPLPFKRQLSLLMKKHRHKYRRRI